MFQLLFAIAIAAGSAGAAQASHPSRDDGRAQSERQLTDKAPRQVAGPVKIRFRTTDAIALRMVLATPNPQGDLAYRLPAATTSMD